MKNLAIESDAAINKLHETDQKYMRQLVANSIQELLKKQRTHKKKDGRQRKGNQNHRKQYKEENKPNEINWNEGNKGNTIVILHKEDYNKNIRIHKPNNFTKLTRDIRKRQHT